MQCFSFTLTAKGCWVYSAPFKSDGLVLKDVTFQYYYYYYKKPSSKLNIIKISLNLQTMDLSRLPA